MTDRLAAQIQIDTRSFEIAMEAKVLIQAHIRECSETRAELLRKFEELKNKATVADDKVTKALSGLYGRVWQATGGLILLLVACLGYFLMHDGLPGQIQPPGVHRAP